MNRNLIFLAFSFLLMPLMTWAQNPSAVVQGTVTNAVTGVPIVGATVLIHVNGVAYIAYYTNVNGGYSATIINPSNGTSIQASTVGSCNGSPLIQNFTYSLGGTNNFTADFSVCLNNGACDASFTYQIAPGTASAQFTNTSVASNPNGVLTYNWAVTDGSGNTVGTSTLANPLFNFAQPDFYDVCLVTNDGLGCMDTSCQMIVINGGTGCNASLTYQITSGSNGNNIAQFTNTSVGSNLSYYWSYSLPGSSVAMSSTSQNGSNILVQSATNVCLTISDGAGCTDSICELLLPCTASSFTYQTTPGSTLTQFTSTSVANNPNMPLSYNWTVTDGSGNVVGTSTLSNPSWNLATGIYNVCLSIADGTGCSDSDCQTIVTNPVNCNAAFSWVMNGLTLQIINSSTVGAGPQYYWSYWSSGSGNSGSSTLQNPSFTFTQPGTYNVCLQTYDNSGCMDTLCQTVTVGGGVLFNTLDVTVSAVAPGTFAPDTFMVYIIQYDSVAGTLTAVDSATAVQGPNGGLASCSFSNLGGSYLVKAAVSTVNSPNYATSIPTYYTNSLFWSTGTYVNLPASSPTSLGINMIQGVNPGGPGFIGGMVSQGANKTGIPNVEIMLLDMNDNPITYTYTNGSGSFNFANLAYGTYKVYAEVTGKPTTPAIITISAAAPSMGSVEVSINSTNVTTALSHNVFFENNVKLYPNPANDMATLQVELKQNSNIEVEISNMFGQVVEKRTTKLSSGLNNLSINVNNLQSGVYFVKVTANGAESEIQKLIVE